MSKNNCEGDNRMKILFLGGNGNISWHCVQKALERGHSVYELNRSMTLKTRRDIQPSVHKLTADIHDKVSMDNILKKKSVDFFDIVVDFICYNQTDAVEAINMFRNITKHFVFISSDVVYERAGKNLPFKENCPKIDCKMINDPYISGKILAENHFMSEYENNCFPVTIVRPSHTYDTIVPVAIGQNCFTAPKKYLEGKPALIGGDGTNLRSIMHSRDFAAALIPLIENKATIGNDFHIATEEWLSWNEAMKALFDALEIKEYRSVHIPYEDALNLDAFQTGEVARQKMWHTIFDMSKLKSYVPEWKTETSFSDGIKETIAWLLEKSVRQRIVPRYEKALDELYAKYET